MKTLLASALNNGFRTHPMLIKLIIGNPATKFYYTGFHQPRHERTHHPGEFGFLEVCK
jgi:hypothetical protein